MNVGEPIGGQDDEVGWLLHLLAGQHVDIENAGRLLAGRILEHLGHPGIGAKLHIGIAQRHWDDGDVGAALGVGLAAEALAEAAILALPEFHSIRICVGLRRVRGRPDVRVKAELFRGLREQLAGVVRNQRGQRILARPRILKWIALLLNLPLDVAGPARDSGGVFELVIVGLELGPADAPVLQRHVGRYEALAVALLIFRADA